MRLRLSSFLFIFFFFTFIFLAKVSAVSAATLSLSPASGSVQSGSTISLDIKLNTAGAQIKTGSVAISYPSDKLEAIAQPNGEYFDPAGSPYSFTLGIPAPTGAIGLTFLKNATPFPSGSSLQIARLTFKAKVGSGTATISFASFPTNSGGTADNSLLDDTSTQVSLTTQSATLTLTGTSNPPPPPPSNPPSTPPSSPPPSSSTPPASSTTTSKTTSFVPSPTTNSGDTTAPKISNLKVSDITINSAKITWTTDEASNSIVEYVETEQYLKDKVLSGAEQSGDMVTSHSITLPSSILHAGYGYTFRVRSIDASGNSGLSEMTEFRTKGYTVKLKVVDKTTLKPLENIKVEFTKEKLTKRTDSEGVALFDDVAQIDQPLKVSFGDKVYLDTIVKVTGESGIGTGESQEVLVKVAGIAEQKQTYRNIGWSMILVGIVALIGIGVVKLKNRSKVSPIQ